MTKKHEELVEEIENQYLGRFWRLGKSGMVIDKTWTRTITRALITLILSAVRDGRLDEELGVVGRFDDPRRIHMDTLDWAGSMKDLGARTFIALSGTGKEEKCANHRSCNKLQDMV